jgi:hypothetical protein
MCSHDIDRRLRQLVAAIDLRPAEIRRADIPRRAPGDISQIDLVCDLLIVRRNSRNIPERRRLARAFP